VGCKELDMLDLQSANTQTARIKTRAWAAALTLLIAGCATTPPPDVQTVLRQAEQAMGGAALRSISFSGSGTGSTFGQAWQANNGWPGLNYSVLSRAIDYEAGAMREDFGRSRAEPNGGGALPLLGLGEQRVTGFLRGDFAWNAGAPGAPAAAAPVAVDARVHDVWTSPHGALKAAQRHGATAARQSADGQSYTTLSFKVPGRVHATAWIDSRGLVTRIDSSLPHPVMGDTVATTLFHDYRSQGGVMFPSRIQQSQGRTEVLNLTVKEVRANAPLDIQVPDNVRGFQERVVAEKVADGVWFLAGGSHNSVAIEMSNHVVLVEAPLYDGRTGAVFDEVKRLLPGKPVRTVVNSHHHFDHAGGLRTAVGEGAQLVTSAQAKAYFERVFANPNSIRADRMAASGKRADIIGVAGQLALNDGGRRIEIHKLQGSVHAQGFLAVYLPKEKLLIQADAYTPAPPNSPPPPAPNANHVNLVQNIERLGLQVERILPLHGRVVPMSELLAGIGRRP
jgi:glyoxylase-like metal-dependent hydrolase (beta-lactamase superfamily II)